MPSNFPNSTANPVPSHTKLEDAELYVKTVFVDGGTMLKRLRPAPQGRAYRVRKRSNHITLVVDDASAELIQQEA